MTIDAEPLNIFVLNGRALRFSFVKGRHNIVSFKIKKSKEIARTATVHAVLAQ